MKVLLILVAIFPIWNAYPQKPEDYVKKIDGLRTAHKLIMKSSTEKTFVGSVDAFYHNDSIVLISTLTDAETAGTETLYFIENGALRKVFVIEAVFQSNDEWGKYYARHKSVNNCYKCHGKPNCTITEITFGEKTTVFLIEKNKKRELSEEAKEKMLFGIKKTFEELKVLEKELQ